MVVMVGARASKGGNGGKRRGGAMAYSYVYVYVCVCVCTWTRRRDAPRLRATRIDEQDETSSNNLIYEYFAATRMLRTSFEYFGAALTNLAKLRKYPRAPTI